MLVHLAAIRELDARALVLRERLQSSEVLPDLDTVVRRAFGGAGPERDVIFSLAHLRVTEPSLPLEALRATAEREGHDAASMVLRVDGPYRRASLAEPNLPVSRLFGLTRRATQTGWGFTGSRAWVRRVNATARERFLRDPRPAVVATLLTHDTTVLEDVLWLASRRPSSAPILRAIATSPWLRFRGVREALAQNPFTETWLSLILLPTIDTHVLDAASVDPLLVETAHRFSARHHA